MKNNYNLPFGKIIRKLNPFSPIDSLYAESWLEDLSSKGLMLYSYNTFYSSKFRVTEPKPRRYRILPYSRSYISDEEMMLYEAAGWEYIASWNCSVFCTDNPESPELFTDKHSLKRYYRKWIFKLSISLLLIIFILYNTVKLYPFSLNGIYRNLHSIEDVPAIPFWFYMIFITIIMLFWIVQFVQTFRLISLLRSSKEIVHRPPYKIIYRLKLLFLGLILGCGIIILSVLAINDFFYNRELAPKDAVKYADNHIYKYSNFNPDIWNDYKNIVAKGDTDIGNDKNADGYHTKIDYSISLDKSYLFPVMRSENLRVHTPDEIDPPINFIEYTCDYYEARNEKLLQNYIEEDIDYMLGFIDDNDFEFKYPGLDYAFYKKVDAAEESDTKYPTQLLYLRKGQRFIKVIYTGKGDLLQKIDEVAERIVL